MANKEEIQIKIDAAVESAEAAKSLGQLRKSLIEIQTLQAEIGDTSGAQFDKLSQASASASAKLAETRDKIGDIQDKTRTLEGTPIERLTGSFGLLKESIMNLDFDKAKIGAEGLLNTFTPVVDGKLVTGLAGVKGAFGMLADGVKNLGSTFMSVGRALLTNPIFLLAAAIIAIVAAVILIMDKLGILKKVIDALMIPINAVIKGFEMLTDWLGLTTNAQEAAATSAKELGETQRAEIEATAKKQQQHLTAIQGMTDDEIAEYRKKAGIRDTLNQNSFDIEKTRLTQTQATLKNEIDALEELKAAGGELTEEQVKDLEQRKKDYKANADAIVAVEEAKVKAIMDANKKATETLRDWKIKNIKDENDRAREQSKVAEAEDIRKIDVAIAEQKRLTGANSKAVKDLEASKTEIHKFYSTQRTTIDEAEHKKAVESNKNAVQKRLEEKEKEKQALLYAIENEREAKLKAENLTGDEILAINKKYDEKILEQTKKNEDDLYNYKVQKGILTGIALKNERERLNDVQAARQKAFEEGQLKDFNERRKTQVEKSLSDLEVELATKLNAEGINNDERLEIQKQYEDKLFAARRTKILTDAEIELSDVKKTEDEKAIIRNNAYLEIVALEDDLNNTRKERQIRELELQAEVSNSLVEKTQFEIDQYSKKVDGVLLLDAKQRDQLIQLDMREQLALLDAEALELANLELTETQKAEIKEKYRQLNIQQQQAAEERLKDLKIKAAQDDLELAQKGFAAVQGLTDAFFAFKKRNLEKGSAEELKAAKQQFNTNKALQLGIATVTGIQSVLSAFANGMKNPVPLLGPATAAVYAAIAGITAAANIAKIAASKFEGGPAPTTDTPTPSTPATPGSPGADGGANAPTNFQPNQFFGLGQQTAVGMPGGPKPIKVYVSEGDIRDVSERVSVIEQRAIY